ncbi:MAG: DinB family protein [Bacteroidetes bacterium]|nr:DinB family protein [Bacteroidota bacterium]
MQRTQWLERTFNFDFPLGMIFVVIERLRGTVPHLKHMTANLTDEQASHKPDGKWSIKEEIGHLSDLEELHDGRLDDFKAGKDTLRAADMANIKTNQALHNQKTLEELIAYFENKRHAFVSRLEKLDDELQNRQAMHPRLQVIMRPVDMAYFTAEHDDHHLTTIREHLHHL